MVCSEGFTAEGRSGCSAHTSAASSTATAGCSTILTGCCSAGAGRDQRLCADAANAFDGALWTWPLRASVPGLKL